jgi:hypothetical protein
MKYEDVEVLIRQKAAEQPRGWQADLARQLGITLTSVTQKVSGLRPRRIPPDQIHVYLNALGLELNVRSILQDSKDEADR